MEVLELQSMQPYQSAWIREKNGIHDPVCEAIDRYYLKKRKEREGKEREDNDEQRLPQAEHSVSRGMIEAMAGHDALTMIESEVEEPSKATVPTVGTGPTTSNSVALPKARLRPPAVRPAPRSTTLRPLERGHSLGSIDNRRLPFGRWRRPLG